jgi:hypothetical protein
MLNRDEKKMAEWFFNLIGVFCHYSFFKDKLWKKVKGFENEDEAEIIAAFMHYWLHYRYLCYTHTVGCGWFCDFDSPDAYHDYIKKYQPVIDAYEEWVIKQR